MIVIDKNTVNICLKRFCLTFPYNEVHWIEISFWVGKPVGKNNFQVSNKKINLFLVNATIL